jgi:hypothetical protein
MRIPVRIVWVIVIAVEWPALASGAVEDGFHRWIFFRDKGISMSGTDGGYGRIPASSLAKRRAVRPETALFDASDRPLVPEYIAAVAGTGAVIRVHSRWLNAVSVLADADQLERIRGLDFVSRDRPTLRPGKRFCSDPPRRMRITDPDSNRPKLSGSRPSTT